MAGGQLFYRGPSAVFASERRTKSVKPKRDRTKPGEAPFYVRGSGIIVPICHRDDRDAAQIRKLNESAGHVVIEAPRGTLYALVCTYAGCV